MNAKKTSKKKQPKKPNPDLITNKEKYVKGWTGGLPETPCGFGSKLSQTVKQREWMCRMFDKHHIHSIADIGAGDGRWIKEAGIHKKRKYRAYDLVPRPSIDFNPIEFNVLTDKVPAVDCVLLIWVLNHFPEAEARAALENVQNSGSKYLLMTWEPRVWDFLDLPYVEMTVIRKRDDERGNVELRLHKLF